MKIEIDGVGIVEIDDAFAQLPPDEQEAVIAEIVASQAAGGQPAEEPKPPADPQRLRSVAQGLLMGFGDELEAGFRALSPNQTYDGALEDVRGKLDAYREDAPMSALGYEMGGALLPAAVAGVFTGGTGAAAVEAGTAARMTPYIVRAATRALPKNRIARTATVSAAEGGIAGFGAGEGGFTERLQSGAQGAALGGVIGGTLPVAVQKSGALARAAGDALGVGGASRAQTFAERKMLQALERDGLTGPDALARLEEAQRLGITDMTPADLGESLRGAGWFSQAVPNPNRQAVVDQFAERQSAQAGQIADAATDMAGVNRTGFEFLDDLEQQVAQEAKPLYASAYQVMLDPKPFQPFMGRKVIADAYKRAQDLADIRGDGTMPPLNRLLAGNALPTEAAHQIKQGLDALIEAETDALTGKVTARGRELVQLKKKWNDEIVAQNGDYGKANAAFADRERLRGAFTMGAKFNAMPEKELVRNVGQMLPAEREALKAGVVTKVQELASGTTDAVNFVKTVFGSPQRRMALRLAFGDPKAFENFERFIKLQSDKVRTNRKVMGGSETVERQMARADGGIDPASIVDLGMNAATGNTLGVVRGAANQVAARATGLNERSADAMSKMLFETDPAKQKRLLELLLQREILDRNSSNRLLRQPELYGGFLGTMSGLLSGD